MARKDSRPRGFGGRESEKGAYLSGGKSIVTRSVVCCYDELSGDLQEQRRTRATVAITLVLSKRRGRTLGFFVSGEDATWGGTASEQIERRLVGDRIAVLEELCYLPAYHTTYLG